MMLDNAEAQARQKIHGHLVEMLELDAPLPDDEDILLSGLLDSIAVMRLVAFLEMEFGVTIPPEDVTVANLANVDAIVAYLATKREQG